jgi:tetratricopeptide (TPR) repeat protein
MTIPDADWERAVADAWASFDAQDEARFLSAIAALVAQRPDDDAPALFEQAAAFDSTGHPDRAVPLYRQALRAGLAGERQRRAVIQLASSMRNLGDPQGSSALLARELERTSDALDDAVRAFLALALADTGREREAVAHALIALAPHLPRYQRSLDRYARALVAGPGQDGEG